MAGLGPALATEMAASSELDVLKVVTTPVSAVARFWDAFRDYARRVWNNSAEDDIFFLAGGIAFNILLAAVPFVLLVVSGLVFALGLSPDASLAEVRTIIDRFLPPHAESPEPAIHNILAEVVKARNTLGIWGAFTFVWFSTRLFGSLRTVLAEIFDIETGRGIIAGKILQFLRIGFQIVEFGTSCADISPLISGQTAQRRPAVLQKWVVGATIDNARFDRLPFESGKKASPADLRWC